MRFKGCGMLWGCCQEPWFLKFDEEWEKLEPREHGTASPISIATPRFAAVKADRTTSATGIDQEAGGKAIRPKLQSFKKEEKKHEETLFLCSEFETLKVCAEH